ncbi:SLAC1 anion channel family protein [Actinocorallia sp. B10E7]|uniref:SLAC1 anion channel family protein n=1 Tax=Actinocorallia sp. B10E7 TaxID=3153558 RepID=UPI00325C7449
MPTSRLEHLPVSLFSVVMGLGGLSLAWRRAARVWDVPEWISEVVFAVALAVFVLVAGLYAAKWIRHTAAARAELRHPVRMAFVPTITISLLLLATAGQDLLPGAAAAAWWAGAVGHLVLTVLVLSAWFGRPDITLSQVTPAWFIPIVGNVITPLAAASLGSADLAWFSFGVGVVFWLGLLPLLLHRVLLHEVPLPQKMLPTLAIFIAPPAVVMLSWQALTGAVADPLGRILYAAAMMFTVLLLAQFARLRTIPFAVPYWAYSFPLAAAATAAIAMAEATPAPVYDVVALALLAFVTVVVAVVGTLTLRAVARREICVPE